MGELKFIGYGEGTEKGGRAKNGAKRPTGERGASREAGDARRGLGEKTGLSRGACDGMNSGP